MNEEDRRVRLSGFTKQLGAEAVKHLIEDGFLTAPASTRFHGSYEGGLFDHSLRVTERLIILTRRERLHWKRRESPIIIGMLHDLCKIDQYEKLSKEEAEEKCASYRYAETEVKGHGEKSVLYARRLLQLTDEEEACIRFHMGAFTPVEEWAEYTDAVHRFKNVLWAHQADMLASHVDMV